MNGIKHIIEVGATNSSDGYEVAISTLWKKDVLNLDKELVVTAGDMTLQITLSSQALAQLAMAMLADCAEQGIFDSDSLVELLDGCGNKAVKATKNLLNEVLEGLED